MIITNFVANPHTSTPLAVWLEADEKTNEVNVRSAWVVGFAVCDDGAVRGLICDAVLRIAETLPNFQGYSVNPIDANELETFLASEAV